ncbi:hypothetical protein H8711_12455 [Clostridiaceae bacterium NSJ-31]|uniref:Uncharacterized protein n=1 Tax=Ligaoa zhengdingensis TaxID=2763658 RepID=A0A926I4S8_9FIRM|nr:hypothetical protein [Ligaoa zhengdingensis]MBC8547729.1 hypothetical protein [Ligaoa zhengdingensis]
MKNYANGPEIPMGLGMALAQNAPAMNHFSALPDDQKQRIIEHTHQIQSKEQMQQFVQKLANNQIDLF